MPISRAFTSIDMEKRPAEAHRREAARLRELAAGATTSRMREELEKQAHEHDRLAGDLVSVSH